MQLQPIAYTGFTFRRCCGFDAGLIRPIWQRYNVLVVERLWNISRFCGNLQVIATEAQVLCPEAINFPPEKSSPALEMILSHIAYVVKVLSTAMLVTLIDEAAQECSLKRLHERFFATVQSEFVPNGTREWPYDAFSAHFEKSVYDFVSHDVVRSTFDVYLSQNEPSAYAAQEASCDSHPGFAEVR